MSSAWVILLPYRQCDRQETTNGGRRGASAVPAMIAREDPETKLQAVQGGGTPHFHLLLLSGRPAILARSAPTRTLARHLRDIARRHGLTKLAVHGIWQSPVGCRLPRRPKASTGMPTKSWSWMARSTPASRASRAAVVDREGADGRAVPSSRPAPNAVSVTFELLSCGGLGFSLRRGQPCSLRSGPTQGIARRPDSCFQLRDEIVRLVRLRGSSPTCRRIVGMPGSWNSPAFRCRRRPSMWSYARAPAAWQAMASSRCHSPMSRPRKTPRSSAMSTGPLPARGPAFPVRPPGG